jgi:hypothetical protein
MHSRNLLLALGVGVGVLLVAAVRPAIAKEPRVAEKDAAELVAKALDAELRGDREQRQRLLEQALKVAPAYSPARWQLGQVSHEGKWSPVDAVARELQGSEKYAQYRELRKATGGTAGGELVLARWCRHNKLPDEEQMHWGGVLQFDSNNLEAAHGLELQKYHGRWLRPEQIEQFKAAEKEFEAKRHYWKPRLERLAEDASGRAIDKRVAALASLRAIDDLAAIPWLEALVSKRSEELGEEVVELLAKRKEQAAIAALVRHALLSEFPAVRKLAIAKLKDRPLDAFAGPLVEGLTAPPEVEVDRYGQNAPARSPSFVRMSVWARVETMTDVKEVDSTFRGMSFSGSFGTETFLGLGERWALLKKLNFLEVVNGRICELLEGVTGLEYGRDEKKWWHWWNDRLERLLADKDKPVRKSDQQSYVVIAPLLARGFPAIQPAPSQKSPSIPTPLTPPPQTVQVRSMFPDQVAYDVNPAWINWVSPHVSCFAAGTLVQTKSGAVPIEKIEPGDTVLSQNAESGELSFKRVLQTTLGPPTKIVELTIDGESIQCTLGHPFWIVGSGWTLAKDLQVGDSVHALHGASKIDGIRTVEDSPAHNLVVADFSSYFVGKQALLVHDITSTQPTTAVVPGHVGKAAESSER